jgi:hypothetical protein
MGFLKRLQKTPDEDEDEGQDEFAAEENGLLMVPSLPRDKAEPATTEGGAAQADVPAAAGGAMAPPQAGPEPAEGALAQAVAGGLDPPDLPASLSATQIQPEPAPGQEPQPEQGPPDEAMDLFRAAAVRENLMPPILKEGVEDVSVTELLAEARSIRDCLSGGRSGTGEREQEAA